MKLLLITATTLILLNSCKKNRTGMFTGKIIKKLIECSSSKGFPYVIATGNGSRPDTLSTVTLPEQFKVVNTRIRFNMRDVKNGDDPMLCSGPVIPPPQVVVFDVSAF